MTEYINYWLRKPPEEVDYKFREDELISEFADYIDSTYNGHYGH